MSGMVNNSTPAICNFFLLGQVYKLRSPSAKFLASLSAYDSSNPTKDWGFPELSVHRQSFPISKSSGKTESKSADGVSDSCLPSLPNQGPTVEKVNSIHNIHDNIKLQ